MMHDVWLYLICCENKRNHKINLISPALRENSSISDYFPDFQVSDRLVREYNKKRIHRRYNMLGKRRSLPIRNLDQPIRCKR